MPSVATVLIADDHEVNRFLIRQLFDEDPDYRVVEAADGAEALRRVATERPDCILLDLLMPHVDGFGVLARLRADPRTQEIPVIVLTAAGDSLEMMQRALRGGALDYLTKPISPLQVGVRVRAAVERHRLLRAMRDLQAGFTSMLVHDLRSPLTVFAAYAELLEREAAGPITDKQRRYLGKMRESCDHMLCLIGEILDLSKLEAGKLTLTHGPVDVAALATEIAERFRPLAEQKRIVLTAHHEGTPVRILADGGRLDQVLMNLVANAVKFTPEGGRIMVEVHEDGTEVEVGIRDSGPGIAPEELPLLFEKFSQTSLGKRAPGPSSGLGLVVCRHLVEAHDGRIWVESELGGGSRFAFRLPRTSPAAPSVTNSCHIGDVTAAREMGSS
jgi:signal transduction histidine kinase